MRLDRWILAAIAHAPRRPRPRSPFLHWLLTIGPFGLFAVAIMDSSLVPIPGGTDVLLVLLTISQRNWIMLAAVAWVGSLIGGYFTYRLAAKGGKPMLQRYVPENRLAGIERHVQRHSFLAILVPCLLPPPVPLVPFVLTAGALNVSKTHFLTAYGIGRAIRYSLIGWLGAIYGRHLLRKWGQFSREWSGPITWGLIALCVCIAGIAIWQYRAQTRRARSVKTGSINPVEAPVGD